MALVDRVQSKPARTHGLPCSVGDLLQNLPDTEAAALQEMLNGRWSGREIWSALRDEGHEVGAQTVNRHRAGACRCWGEGK